MVVKVIFLGFFIAIATAFLLLRFTKIERRWAELIGACTFGGIIGAGGVSVISAWPLWLITIVVILFYCIVDTIILDALNARR